jgi:hypothetical protein
MVELHQIPTALTVQTDATVVSAVNLTLVVIGLTVLLMMVVLDK